MLSTKYGCGILLAEGAINEFDVSINENRGAINEFYGSINEFDASINHFSFSINGFPFGCSTKDILWFVTQPRLGFWLLSRVMCIEFSSIDGFDESISENHGSIDGFDASINHFCDSINYFSLSINKFIFRVHSKRTNFGLPPAHAGFSSKEPLKYKVKNPKKTQSQKGIRSFKFSTIYIGLTRLGQGTCPSVP